MENLKLTQQKKIELLIYLLISHNKEIIHNILQIVYAEAIICKSLCRKAQAKAQ